MKTLKLFALNRRLILPHAPRRIIKHKFDRHVNILQLSTKKHQTIDKNKQKKTRNYS